MAGTQHDISSTEITWEQTESEIAFNESGGAEITVMGLVAVGTSTAELDNAIRLMPNVIPISASGPIGTSDRYTGALLTKPSAKFSGDDLIEVRGTYQIAVLNNQLTDPDGNDTSDDDRATRSVVTEQVPILIHPVVRAFPKEDKRQLAALREGSILSNPIYKEAGTGQQLWEFITEDENGTLKESVFSTTTVTVDGITASPYDYAVAIAAGVETWERPSIKHSLNRTRNNPATNAEYTRVGEVVSTPILAPTLTRGQWMLTGITDSTENNKAWQTSYEFIHTGSSGALRIIYKDGTGEIGD